MCSFIINNEFYIMGGENEYKHQQLKLSGCGFQEKIANFSRIKILTMILQYV